MCTAGESGRIDFVESAQCWLCGGAYVGDKRVCSRCGSTRVLMHESERLQQNANELISLMQESEEIDERVPDGEYMPASRRRARALSLFSANSADFVVFLAYGVLGAFIGGSIWCMVAILLHSDVGVLASVMAFCTGKGVAIAAPYRRAMLTPIAMLLTAAMCDVCSALHTSQGIPLTPLDVIFCIVSLVVAAAPIDFLPRDFSAR